MKKIVPIMALGLTLAGCQAPTTQSQFGDKSIDDIIAAMSPEDKANFVIGTNRVSETPPDAPESLKQYPRIHPKFQKDADKFGVAEWADFEKFVATYSTKGRVQGAAGQHWANDTLGIPAFVYADGPAGLRIDAKREGDEGEYYCTAFPTETALAATWDVSLVKEVTTAMGNETKEYGADILLAPAINIHRNPLCGRNFEYFSEDPFLVGKMAAAYINGIQSNGVGTSLKHFAVNNQETHRNGVNEVVSMRALREIYLKGFEMAVKESQPWTIMSSYNKINGVFASENHWLLEDVLRGEWGYEGFVMTDWWAQENGVRQQLAGNDLLMPGTQRQYEEVLEGIKDGSLPQEVIDRNIRRILTTMAKSPIAQGYEYSNKPDLKAHAEITHRVACEGMVLLKNGSPLTPEGGTEKKALPLNAKTSLALFGNASYEILVGGSGSGNVNRKYKVSLLEGMNNAGFAVADDLAATYKKYIEAEKAKKPAENFWTVPVFDEMLLNELDVNDALTVSDAAIFTICRMAGEGGDRKNMPGDYQLSDAEKSNLAVVSKVAHAKQKPLIVILNMGNIIDMKEVLANNPDAILHAWLGGQEAGNSIADVLSGKVNPSGKLPMTWAKNYEDYASSKNFPFTEGDSITRYEEDIYVGYRQFDKENREPLYPFGYGLSYTTFEYSKLNATVAGDDIKVTVNVKNTGKVAGKESVQIYVSAPASSIDKPVKELKGFAKTQLLEPGKSETLTIITPRSSLASWTDDGWKVDSGEYTIHAAANAIEIRLSEKVQLP